MSQFSRFIAASEQSFSTSRHMAMSELSIVSVNGASRFRPCCNITIERQKRVEKLCADPATDLDSDTWVAEAKRLRGKKQPVSSAGLYALGDEYTRTIEPARALVAEALTLERNLSDFVNRAYALTQAETALLWQIAPPRTPVPAPSDLPRTREALLQPLAGLNYERPVRGPADC